MINSGTMSEMYRYLSAEAYISHRSWASSGDESLYDGFQSWQPALSGVIGRLEALLQAS